MTNAVYNLTVRTLSGIVSERAAETMLRAALREQGLAPEGVSARDMGRVLEGPLLGRLSGVLPAAQARAELGALARQLAGPPGGEAVPGAAAPVAAWDETPGAETGSWEDGPLLGADDFEFDDPDHMTPPGERTYDLEDPADQDALIAHLGRMTGVQGVLVCRATGEVLRERSLSGAANLGSVIAATALLFQKRALRLMSADLGGRTVCMRPLGACCVAVVAGPQVNVGRLLTELQLLREAP
nr:roadblock/LC7 domain-containing protein [Deinococcus aestuarii]